MIVEEDDIPKVNDSDLRDVFFFWLVIPHWQDVG